MPDPPARPTQGASLHASPLRQDSSGVAMPAPNRSDTESIEAWRRTLIAQRSPDYEAAIAWAQEHEPSADGLLDVQELLDRLAVNDCPPERQKAPPLPSRDGGAS